eukprot:c19095_g3_i1 orf=3-215(-)
MVVHQVSILPTILEEGGQDCMRAPQGRGVPSLLRLLLSLGDVPSPPVCPPICMRVEVSRVVGSPPPPPPFF